VTEETIGLCIGVGFVVEVANSTIQQAADRQLASAALSPGADDRPGRHKLNLERGQTEDCWRDVGGPG